MVHQLSQLSKDRRHTIYSLEYFRSLHHHRTPWYSIAVIRRLFPGTSIVPISVWLVSVATIDC